MTTTNALPANSRKGRLITLWTLSGLVALAFLGAGGTKPRLLPASAMVCGGPPAASTLFSFPSAKNPRERLSGAQKGCAASSVPGSGCELVASSRRTHNSCFPPSALATNASVRPSGEIEKSKRLDVSGVTTESR